MVHQDAHGLIKLTIFSQIGHINLGNQPTCYAYQATYLPMSYVLPFTYLPIYLSIYLLIIYLPTYVQCPTIYLPTYLFIYLLTYYLPTYLYLFIYLPIYYLPTYLLVVYISRYVHLKTQVGRHVYLPLYLVRYLLIYL